MHSKSVQRNLQRGIEDHLAREQYYRNRNNAWAAQAQMDEWRREEEERRGGGYSAPLIAPYPFETTAVPSLPEFDLVRYHRRIVTDFNKLASNAAQAEIAADQQRKSALAAATTNRDHTLRQRQSIPSLSAQSNSLDNLLQGVKLSHVLDSSRARPTPGEASKPAARGAQDEHRAAADILYQLDKPVRRLHASKANHSVQTRVVLALMVVIGSFLAFMLLPVRSDWIALLIGGVACVVLVYNLLRWLQKSILESKLEDTIRRLGTQYGQHQANAAYWLQRWQAEVTATNHALDQRTQQEYTNAVAHAEAIYQQTFILSRTESLQDSRDLVDMAQAQSTPTDFSNRHWTDTHWISWERSSGYTTLQPLRMGEWVMTNPFGKLSIAAALPVLGGRPLLFIGEEGQATPVDFAIQTLIVRLLATFPGEALRVMVVAPYGLGDTLSRILVDKPLKRGLAEYDVVADQAGIDEVLDEIINDMKEIDAELRRRRHPHLTELHAFRRRLDPPYTLLIVRDFPQHFSAEAVRRLLTIGYHGPRCGVHTLIQTNRHQADTSQTVIQSFGSYVTRLVWGSAGITSDDPDLKNCQLQLDPPPPAALVKRVLAGIA